MYEKGKFGLKKITMPSLTQKLGPYILYDKNMNDGDKIEYEYKICQQIIDALPAYDVFDINFDQQYKNWLPFYWNGFQQTVRYSYRLYDIKNYDTVFLSFEKKKRNRIKKAREKLIFCYDLPVDIFYEYFKNAVSDRGVSVSFTYDTFMNIYNALYSHNAGRAFYCIDEQKNIHAVKLVIWDNNAAYSLIGMRKKEYNVTGGTEFLTENVIKYVSDFVDIFDFEGSMIKGVEEAYRYYGTQQTEYYSISKVNSKLLKLYRALRS